MKGPPCRKELGCDRIALGLSDGGVGTERRGIYPPLEGLGKINVSPAMHFINSYKYSL